MKRSFLYLIILVLMLSYSVIITSCKNPPSSKISYQVITFEDRKNAKNDIHEYLNDNFDIGKMRHIMINNHRLSPGILELVKNVQENKISKPKNFTIDNFIGLCVERSIFLEGVSYEDAMWIFSEKGEALLLSFL